MWKVVLDEWSINVDKMAIGDYKACRNSYVEHEK